MQHLAYTHALSIHAIDQAPQDEKNPSAAQKERDKDEKMSPTTLINNFFWNDSISHLLQSCIFKTAAQIWWRWNQIFNQWNQKLTEPEKQLECGWILIEGSRDYKTWSVLILTALLQPVNSLIASQRFSAWQFICIYINNHFTSC